MPAHIDYAHGITAIDSGFERPMLDAVHLVVEGDRAALVDTASNASLPRVVSVLESKGLSPEQVDYVFMGHVLGAGAGQNNLRASFHAFSVYGG